MAGRLSPPKDPVTFTLDGERIVAERGEPVAAALWAAGKILLARSPKYHRPRGPSCMRGACDGCLLRVDGVPNVMTCLVASAPGLTVTSQNSLGSREVDLLRVTDWFFPEGLNHHELFAGVPGVQSAMQLFARRVAGLGRLPDASGALSAALSAAPARRREVPLLVVGAGVAGQAMAIAGARRGLPVELVDDALEAGGGGRGVPDETSPSLRALRHAFREAVQAGQVRLRSKTVAAGFFGRDILVVAGEGETESVVTEVVTASACVLAVGAHDGVLPFENNDLPGILSARAACRLASSGILLGKNVVLLAPPRAPAAREEIRFGDVFEQLAARFGPTKERAGMTVTRVDEVVRVKGTARVRGVVVRRGGREVTLAADVLVVDAPRSPAYELVEQAGGTLEHRPDGYVPVSKHGLVAPGVWAVGEVTGGALSVEGFVAAAEEVAGEL